MERLTEAILRMTNELSEGAPISARMLLRLGTRTAIDQSLLRLAQKPSTPSFKILVTEPV